MDKVKPTQQREENPFEDEVVAQEWIRSVEGERSMTRDKEIYPMLKTWASNIGDGTIVEIGSGQGICSQQLGSFRGEYIGIEPSEILTKRATELYGKNEHLHFVVGNAYTLPVATDSADGVISINVWFHLADLEMASQELARILKKEAAFNIVTTNPDSHHIWRSMFVDYTEHGNMISGKVNLPINPLTRNDFYMYTLKETTDALKEAGLEVDSIQTLGTISKHPEYPLFVSIQGRKK